MTNKIAPYDGPMPEGWNGGESVTKHWRGVFVHLYRVHRPCKTCGITITLDVTKAALQGFKQNAGLLLRNCPECRKIRKEGGTGSRGGHSRPTVDESEAMAQRTMKEELDGCYATIKDLRDRLAKYELPLAIAKSVLPNRLPWE